MKSNIVILVVILMVISLCSCSKNIYSFKGGSITISDLEKDEHFSTRLFELQQEEYTLKRRLGHNMAMEIILDIEAKEKNVADKYSLIKDYVKKEFKEPTEAELKKAYKEYAVKEPFSEIRARLYNHVVNQQKSRLRDNYLAKLTQQYQLTFHVQPPEIKLVNIDIDGEPSWGPKDAKLTIVEFSDYECPYCKRLQNDIRRIRKEYEGKVRWVFKDFPLNFHKNAMKMHIAANCAQKQNRYFEMQYHLFDVDKSYKDSKLKEIAKEVGLNVPTFLSCVKDSNNQQKEEISKDIKEGRKIGVNGTPTLFVNGRRSTTFRSYDVMKDTIDDILNDS